MEDLIGRYKRELNERVSLKKTINKTKEQIILDNFKYFDLTSSNYCNINDFIKANERIGVKMPYKDDLYKVFSYYDNNNSGLMNYRIFSKNILSSNLNDINNNYIQNDFINKNNNNNNLYGEKDKFRIKRDNYINRNKTSKDNHIFKSNYNNILPQNNNNNNNIKYTEYSSYNKYNDNDNNTKYEKNYIENGKHKNNNYNENRYKTESQYEKRDKENNNYENNNNSNQTIPITQEELFEKIIIHLVNNNNLPSKSIILFYKNFKINQRSKLYNKIPLEEFMDIINHNKINLTIKEIQTLFHYYKNPKDGNFYYEKFFDDILGIYWDEERQNFTKNKIREILNRNRNKNKTKENNKIKVEDFYNIISITKNNNYNNISVNNYFKNKLNISYPDEYYNEIVRIFMEIKYLSTSNKDSSLNDKDILQLIKFISFGIKLNEDFYTAINYIFNTNKYSTLNKNNIYINNKNEQEKNNNRYINSQRNFVNNKFNYNTSLSSLIIIRKYMIEHGIKTFIKIIKELNYYSNGNRFIKKYDFAKVLKDFNISMTVNDIEQIFDFFCEDKKKLYLNYYKFIDILLNEFISKERLEQIKDVFKKIEKYLVYIGHYELNLEALKDIYNSKNNYYQYNEKQAINDFCDNFILFHNDFYMCKIYGGKDNRHNKAEYDTNFIINEEEFVEFYKMVSFIIEKDDMFNDIIFNEWSNALIPKNNKNNKYNAENNDNNKYRIICDKVKNNRDEDEYDDYNDYNIKNNSPKKINYIKLKKDLGMSPPNNKNKTLEHIATESDYNKVQKIPIHNLKQRHSSRDDNYNRKENHKNHIIRPNSSLKQYNNNFNIFNKTFDTKAKNYKNDNHNNNENNNIYDNYNNKSPLEKLISKLKMRGLRGLMNLHKQFLFTCNNLSEISFSHFITVLKNQKISLDKEECKQIFLKFRKKSTKFLDFPKFIREFKKPLNEKRLEVVEDAFAKLDVDSNDNIFIDTIKRKYNPKGDPLVLQGIKNEEEVSTEFLDCFELNYNLLTAVDNQNVTNVVSFEEFANFYEYVSFLYDDDYQFIKLVNDSWDD